MQAVLICSFRNSFLKSIPNARTTLFLLAYSETTRISMMHFSGFLSPVLIFASLITLSTPFKSRGLNWYYLLLPLSVGVIHQFTVGT